MKKISLSLKVSAIAIAALAFHLNTITAQVATIQNWTNVYHGAAQSQQNLNYTVPTGSNSTRIMLIAVSASKWSAGQIAVTLAYGGQTLALAEGDMGTSTLRQHTALYYLNEAGLDAASGNTLATTVSAGGATMVNTDIWVAVFDYVNQASPLTSIRNYNSLNTPLTNFSLGTALTINAYNQAVEVVNSYNPQYNVLRTITYAANWTLVRDSTKIYQSGTSGASIRNGVANRDIPNSNITDASSTTFSGTALASMTALSLNYESPPPPTIQTTNITFSDVTSSSFTINWTSGNGTNRIVLVKAGSAVDSDPVDGTTYTASDLFGSGSEIGTGNFVVYNSSGYNVTVFNLDGNTVYHVAVYEFSGPPGLQDYLLTTPARGSQLTLPETGSSGDYRSFTSGNWGTPGTWQTLSGSSWVTAVASPSSSTSGIITIRNGHTVVVDSDVTADQVVIEGGAQVSVNSGVTLTIADGTEAVDCSIDGKLFNEGSVTSAGTLAFNNGSEYQHPRDGGSIPTATWDVNSTCLITGITSTAPTGFGQSFGNFTWNCISQTVAAAINSNLTIKGDLRISSTGTGRFSVTNNNPVTLTIEGRFFQTSGIFDFNSGSSSSAVATMNVAGHFSFTGGTITETSSGRGSIVFNGSSIQNYTSGGAYDNTIDFTVNSGAYLQMGTGANPSYISTSNGTFTLSSGATLGITDRYGITVSTTGSSGGNIRVTGTRNFETGANYIYNGSGVQNTGSGLPSTVNSLVFNNTGGTVSMTGAYTATTGISIASGSRLNLKTFNHSTSMLTLGGTGQPGGSYGGATSGADYELTEFFDAAIGIINNGPPAGTWLGLTTDWNLATNWIGGVPTSVTNATITSAVTNQPVISGTTSALCNILTINSQASLTISGSAEVTTANNSGTITISPGGKATIATLINNGTLNLESDASGMFSLILGNYSGPTGTVNAGVYFSGGLAGAGMWKWHYVAVPFQQNKSVLTDINPDDLMNYVESRAVTNKLEGWQWSDGYGGTVGFNELLITEGYNFYNFEDAYVTFSGNSLLTSLPVKNLSFSVFGWNFFGNSLTCGINWDNVILTGNMNTAVHFLKDYQEYYYIPGGPGVPSGTTGHIPPLQGFFVQAFASGASIDFTNAREHNDTPFYKGKAENLESKSSFPLIRLTLGNNSQKDETIIWFNDKATMGYDNKFDAQKWVSEDLRAQIYSISQDREYAINGIPVPSTSVKIPLAFRVPNDGTFSINQISLENVENYGFYLKDLVQNTTVNLNNIHQYSFSASKGTIKDRFILIIENLSAGINDISDSDKPFNIYSSFGYINIELVSDIWEGRQGTVKIVDLTGRTLVDSRNLEFSKSSHIQLPVRDNKGVVIVEMLSAPLKHTARVIIR